MADGEASHAPIITEPGRAEPPIGARVATTAGGVR
jgi:hypothetical protein